jgi:hypothetical protein
VILPYSVLNPKPRTDRWVRAAKVAALGSATLLMLASTGLVIVTAILEHHGASALAGTAGKLNADLDQLHTDLFEVHSLINDARGSIVEVNRNVLDERKMYETTFPDVIGRIDKVLANVDTATGDVDPLLKEVTARVHDLKPIEDNAADTLLATKTLIADPHIPAAIANLDDTSVQLQKASVRLVVIEDNVAATTSSVKAIAADGQHVVHSYVYPKPIATIAEWMIRVIHAAGAWL